MKVLIVGGVAGGATAATRLRRLNEDAQIILFERGEYISYANCGLPYYIGGGITDKEKLVVTKTEVLKNRYNLDIRTENEVIKVNPQAKTVTVKDLKTGRLYDESYDKLLLSPGAMPKRPNLPGIDSEGIFTLRNIPDTHKIDNYIREKNAKKAVVVGAGFIGVEMAENLIERGLEVTIVEFLDQAIASLDPEMAALIHNNLEENGVKLIFKTGVSGFDNNNGLKVILSNEDVLEADLAILSIGVAPDSHLAKEAGLELSLGGSILVNDNYATSDPDIYAVGDAISVKHFINGQITLIPLAGPANKQGRIAAENISGRKALPAHEVQGTAALKVFDLTAASTGMTEKQLKQLEIPYLKTYIHPTDHATYYPGATPLAMKMLFSPEGKILGAQGVGYNGVDKRIDVIATAMRLKASVYDLEDLELCYAPPYSSAKDPVNYLGYTAANILKGDVKPFDYQDIETLDLNKVSLLDVSTPDEFLMGSIEGTKHIPLDELRQRLDELPQDKPVYVFCRVGLRGYIASRVLRQKGYEVYNLNGGYRTYNTAKGKKTPLAPIPALNKDNNQAIPGQDWEKTIEVDACGLQCPGPIMKVAEGIKDLNPGEFINVKATDPAFASDIAVWCEKTGNKLIGVQRDKGVYHVRIQKGQGAPAAQIGNDKSMIIFSGDLDKALAALIIANGAASMGRKVTLFFTFWGLNILRKDTKIKIKKPFMEKMFSAMMPRGSKKLGLSRMNMLGMGSKMIRGVMKSKNVHSLEELLQSAHENGVRLVACQMSMDIMGIRREELIDSVELAGVATFLGSAESSDTNLFI